MKKVSLRASFAIIMALLVIVGLVLYVFRFVQDGEKWALYFDESTSKCTYTLRDRDGTVLAKMGGGSRNLCRKLQGAHCLLSADRRL